MKKFLRILLLTALPFFSFAQVSKYVNPFIGTSNGGNTFPGAVVPWGMVSISPHNAPGSPSGYLYGSKYIYGFGHTHLSGTGCSDFGSVIISAATGDITDNQEIRTTYSGEIAEPGYYSVHLDKFDINAEASATIRSGILKFSSFQKAPLNIFIEAGKSLNLTGGGYIKIVSPTEFEGYNISGGFCGENNRQIIYFAGKVSEPSDSNSLWVGNTFVNSKEMKTQDTSIGCFFRFNNWSGNPIYVKTGISYVSIENARLNLDKEINDWQFETIRKKAKDNWDETLSRIEVTDQSDTNKIKFYSAIYHMLIHPNIISDVNGDYPLMGRKGTGNYKNQNRYSVFSLWDTYRTLHPLLTLIYPEVQSEIIKTMIDMSAENGFLPKWELAGNETYMMVGDGASITIADSYIKGINDFDTLAAFNAMLKPVSLKENEDAPPVRAGYHELLKYSYIPFEQDHSTDWWVWGPVSTTLEYNLADWAISQMAYKMGKQGPGKLFFSRSMFYKNLFDKSTLFMRPKLKSGSWLTPFDSMATEGSGDWGGSGGPGYVEGNAWNYSFFVPFDTQSLIELYGGERIFSNRLIRDFEEKHFSINNEPDFAYPYLFTYVKGKENLTDYYVRKIMDNEFNTGANGLPGNDDCGTTSAWFVFSALGFYPDCPASLNYSTGVPLFDEIKINLSKQYYSGKKLIIKKETGNKSEKQILLNNRKITNYKINHFEITRGGTLLFR